MVRKGMAEVAAYRGRQAGASEPAVSPAVRRNVGLRAGVSWPPAFSFKSGCLFPYTHPLPLFLSPSRFYGPIVIALFSRYASHLTATRPCRSSSSFRLTIFGHGSFLSLHLLLLFRLSLAARRTGAAAAWKTILPVALLASRQKKGR